MDDCAGHVAGLYRGERVQMDMCVAPYHSLSRCSIVHGHVSTPTGTLVNKVLLEGSATPIVDRYLAFVDNGCVENVRNMLFQFGSAAFVQETLWIEFPAIRTYDHESGTVGGITDTVSVFLLTREQMACIGASPGSTGETNFGSTKHFLLPNDQIIHVPDTGEPYRRILQRYLPSPQRIQADGARFFQSFDSSDYIEGHGSPHSYFAVVHTSYQDAFEGSWVLVSTPKLASVEFGEENHVLSFPVLIRFSDTISPFNIALDQTVSTAIGLNEGEVVELKALSIRARNFRRSIFSFRHTIVRVSSTNAMDMEKPIVRIEAGVQDILGVATGDRVVIESYHRGKGRLGRIVIRQLEDRGVIEDRSRGALSISALTGDMDIPIVSMDLATRKRLGCNAGTRSISGHPYWPRSLRSSPRYH